MDLSSIGFEHKQFRVVPVERENLVTDFIQGKFRILGVECNSWGAYGSIVQQSVARRFPNVLKGVNKIDYDVENVLGRTHMYRVHTRQRRDMFVANMHVSRGYGVGAPGSTHAGEVVNRYSEKFLIQSVEDLLEQCDKLFIPTDKEIALSRFFGGLGGVPWAEVRAVLDDLCMKHQFNLLVYLPGNYDAKYVRGI